MARRCRDITSNINSLRRTDGKVNFHMTITQSEVDEHFVMLVPIFAEFGKGMVRIGASRNRRQQHPQP